MQLRNVAIIAHVDHGKTTLVDAILKQCLAFAEHETVEDRVMDSMDLERERGITITSKNTAVMYGSTKINIVDTPGHADFGGEVERVLRMVDGALLLVDASEGPLPQTRFVLRKAMEAGLKVMVCVNKIDRPDARVAEVLDEIYDLFIELDADDDQIDFPVLYACARDGIAFDELEQYDADGSNDDANLRPLLDTIVSAIPGPPEATAEHGRVLVTNLDYDSYVGRLCLGRVIEGKLRKGQARWFHAEGDKQVKVQLLYTWMGLKRHEVDEAEPGDIIAIAGIPGITVGDTVAQGDEPEGLPRVMVDEPTIGMEFSINTSPFGGQEGKFVTARQIRERLERELMSNVSMAMEPTSAEVFKVYGRGELQLAILIEQMRREGFELSLSRPRVVTKEDPKTGKTLEPFEQAVMDIPDEHVGFVTQAMAARKATLLDMKTDGTGRTTVEYRIPSRGLIGFRNEFLTNTRGEGIINTLFDGWDEDAGQIVQRQRGAIISDRTGKTTAYGLHKLLPRGDLFIGSAADVYEGMIVGIHTRENDLNVDATRSKQLTNFRSAGADEKTVLPPPLPLTLESAMDFIDDSEWIEVTPTKIRLRKRVLKSNERSIIRHDKKTAPRS